MTSEDAAPTPASLKQSKREIRRVVIFVVCLFVIFMAVSLAVSLAFARRNYYGRLKECDANMAPLLAQRATPEAVRQRLGDDGERFTRSTHADLMRLAFSGGERVAEIEDAAFASASSRVYRPTNMVYFVFFDATDHVRQYLCLGNGWPSD